MQYLTYLVLLSCIGCSNVGAADAPIARNDALDRATLPAVAASIASVAPRGVPVQPEIVGASAAPAPPEVVGASVDSAQPAVVVLDPAQRPVTFVLRGKPTQPIVFLAGLCGHAQYYVQSFQQAAARRGTVVAPQGEHLCGTGPYSTLSGDIKKLNQRIADAFAALAIPDQADTIVIGYSLGATLAQALARHYPERYTRLVLIAAPAAPTPWGLKKVKRTVVMAGSLDRKDLMRRGLALMQQASIPSIFLELPGAAHGQMGHDAERVMADALDFVLEGRSEPPQSFVTHIRYRASRVALALQELTSSRTNL